ncbi:MAG: zinc metalloprotease HtpX [Microscillaceae bacterium]|nr:zinc metalloprotease HtpX [Microscillaceae bacterium]
MLRNDKIINHKLNNTFYTIVYLLSLVIILGVTGFLLAGAEGLFWMVFIGAILIGFVLLSPARLQLKIYGARKLSYYESPALFDTLDELASKAGLSKRPELYLIPSQSLNAFATGTKDQPLIGLTKSILQILSLREIRGVMAHEISHLKNHDTQVMLVAQILNRMTSNLSFLGKVLLLINLPLILIGEVYISWLAILLLIGAPYISLMLSMALSRIREFEADLGAAELTQDPDGLADALEKIEYYQRQARPFWWGTYKTVEIPGIWRSHPLTQSRIEKLRSLVERYKPLEVYLSRFWS